MLSKSHVLEVGLQYNSPEMGSLRSNYFKRLFYLNGLMLLFQEWVRVGLGHLMAKVKT